MSRRQWKDLMEAVGFAAVVASLIFVGFETRSSTKQAALTAQALELSAYQQRCCSGSDTAIWLFSNINAAQSTRLDFDRSSEF
jgi:hypothetical protein